MRLTMTAFMYNGAVDILIHIRGSLVASIDGGVAFLLQWLLSYTQSRGQIFVHVLPMLQCLLTGVLM